ncbi:acyltransferase [Legionella wadsworthii]|uniref:Acyltransferase n=1 Tax=Legionella wadsworthii TaxID=28088 RepID=A0A378LU89_9GAMM|nr:acyltransferase [Legionella wadsworthii]
MNIFLRCLGCAIILSLCGCQMLKPNTIKSPAAHCNMVCVQHFELCQQRCINNCPNCTYIAHKMAEVHFAKYVHEQKVEGKKVMRELNSYRDPLQCRKVTCDCLADLAICKKGCTGVIPTKLQAVPYCV